MASKNIVIAIAKAEVGYLEKRTNAFLDNKRANAGMNNFTKYGLARGCNGQPWCDAFVDWCFIESYGKEEAEKLLCGFSNYTPTSAEYFKKNGLWATTRPQVGDVIFFKNTARICHTGLVYAVDANKVYTIEGNTSGGAGLESNGGAVAMKSYALNYSRIAGYGRPNYEGTDKPVLYKGCQGVAVKKLQKAINKHLSAGFLKEDGDFGGQTQLKLIEVQGYLDITKDGICGTTTWGKL